MKPLVDTKTLAIGAVALVIGLLIGWMVLGWVVAPVQYINAGPANLSDLFKVQYVQLVADSFALSGNLDLPRAQERMSYLCDGVDTALQQALANTSGIDNIRVATLTSALKSTGEAVPAAADCPKSSSTGGNSWTGLLLPVCGALVVVALLVGGGLYFWQNRNLGPRPKTARASSTATGSTAPFLTPVDAGGDQAAQPQAAAYTAGEEPVSKFKTTYMLGNDLFDESFSIDDQQGDFLGECGVGISETVGVGDPKKVTAFEVWLFDKNDIRTVTNVLMSDHAFRDEGLKSRLAAKGEPVLAKSGEMVRMETATLKVEARLVDMQYGSGVLPPNSFFQQLTIEISAWKK
ncbi:MAG: hypothetical protein HY872_04970 [Chloroflexi bacterium]|nr:hypothetical protein [Chloroflexota bacterium]MBI5830587.1 hypothetical protein [Chloroflexota bacterium]